MAIDTTPGFITVNAINVRNHIDTYQISIAIHAIRSVNEGFASTSKEVPATIVSLINPDISYPVAHSHEQVMGLIRQAQSPPQVLSSELGKIKNLLENDVIPALDTIERQ